MQEVLSTCASDRHRRQAHVLPTDYLRKTSSTKNFPSGAPPSGDSAYFHRVSNQKAVAQGLVFRPLLTTPDRYAGMVEDAAAGTAGQTTGGDPADKEAEILRAYRASERKP